MHGTAELKQLAEDRDKYKLASSRVPDDDDDDDKRNISFRIAIVMHCSRICLHTSYPFPLNCQNKAKLSQLEIVNKQY